MTLLTPLAALFGLAIPAIVALYFLKVRRRPVPVSSTLLWRPMVRDRQANVPWQRLRFSWLLVLQLLAAAALVLALMRPAQSTPASLAAHTIVMVDASATMQATDVHPSRFAEAKARAEALIGRMGPQDRVTLMVLSDNPSILADSVGNKGPLRSALEGLQVVDGGADLQQAFALAASVAGSGTDTELVLYSDGITDPVAAPIELPYRLSYQPIGTSGENLAITALSAQPASGGQQGFVHVQNFGKTKHTTLVDFSVDGRLTDAKAVTLDPGAGQDLLFALPAGAEQISASLSPHDAFGLDDAAWAVVRPASGYKALLVSTGDVFLQQALGLVPGVSVTAVSPTVYAASTSPPPADLYIFDGYLPAALPDAPLLLVDPPSGAAGPIGGLFKPGPLEPATADPAAAALLADINLSGVQVAEASDLTKSGFGSPLITSPGGPVALLRDPSAGSGTTRGVLIGFSLHNSDLPLQNAFPLLMERLAGWLLPQASAPSYAPDTAVPLGASGGDLAVMAPGGSVSRVAATSPSCTPLRPGIFSVLRLDAGGGGHGQVLSRFAVDAFSPQLSATSPVTALNVSLGGGVRGGRPRRADKDWWPWAAAAALVFLSAEWVVFHRGI